MYTITSGGDEDLHVALMETQALTCRPTSIISFTGNCCSVTALTSASRAVSTFSGTAEDGAVEDYFMPAGPATTSGVVAMAEVSVTDLLCIYSDTVR